MQTQRNPYIQYISILVGEQKAPKKMADLSDCLIINELLSAITEFKLPKLEQTPKTFAQVFSNLKQTYHQIESFWDQFLNRSLECGEIDLVEIAHHSKESEVIKIVDLFIQTTVQSSAKEYFIGKILETSPQTQQYFMNIVEKTLQSCSIVSPRKKKEQRLYDKLIELDHENENLQNIIKELCEDKFELQTKYQHLIDGIKEKNIEIERLSGEFSEFYQTPQRRKNGAYDSIDKNSQLVQRLKSKISQMTKDHQKQIYNYEQQIEVFTQKMERLIELQTKVELDADRMQSTEEILNNNQKLSQKVLELDQQGLEKSQVIHDYLEKLNEKEVELRQHETNLLDRDATIEKMKNKIEQLKQYITKNHQDQNASCLSPVTLRKTLSEHCPDVFNTQTQILLETNKKLREQLQRASATIRQREIELEKLRKQFEQRQDLQTENRKLVSIIQQNNQRHEDEKYLLLGCMYQVRARYLKQGKQREKKQQVINKGQNSYQIGRTVKKGLRVLQNFNYQ